MGRDKNNRRHKAATPTVQHRDGQQMKQVKRKDTDKATLAFVLARIYRMVEPAKLERSSKAYSEEMERALQEIIEACEGGLNYWTHPGKQHQVQQLQKDALGNLKHLKAEISVLNGRRGRDVAQQEWIDI